MQSLHSYKLHLQIRIAPWESPFIKRRLSAINVQFKFKFWMKLPIEYYNYSYLVLSKQEESARERALCQLTECF